MGRFAYFRGRALGQNQLADTVGKIQQFVNRRAAMVPGARALNASLSLIEYNVTPFRGLQAVILQFFIGVADAASAMLADGSHQALGEHAIQGGNEVVGLYAHVQEASQHVDHVIGVHGGEDQVAGQRGLDGDLRGFRIADFAHHDLIGVVAQDGAQPAGKSQPFLLVDGNLRDSFDLVLNRILDGDDLVFVGLDLIQCRIESGGLAAARWPGDQHHPVRLQNVAAELAQIVFVKADYIQHQVAELLAHRLLVQNAQHGILAMNGGHDGDAEVDQAVVVLHTEAAVLGHTALGDVQLAHDLHARDDGGVVLLGHGLHGRLQHAVNAVFHHHGVAFRFDVNIAGPLLQCGKNRGIDQANNGADIGFCRDTLDVQVLVARALFISHHVEHEAFAGLIEHALRLLGLGQDVIDLDQSCDFSLDTAVEQQADFVDHHQLAGIRDGNPQGPVFFFQRDEAVAEHQVHGHGLEKLSVKMVAAKIDEIAAVAGGELASARLAADAQKVRLGTVHDGGIDVLLIHKTNLLRQLGSQRKDWKVQREQNHCHRASHDDE